MINEKLSLLLSFKANDISWLIQSLDENHPLLNDLLNIHNSLLTASCKASKL